uniref:Uncharacterized protein n=3 Tax=Candidatus Kentrum eta TaxID=2126337 RepID=A0A450W408_9GAMM|nr:MAG: hypothetical protein BECKH772B_GA0070898_108531 [Candidatus Kentron sp. H]VFK11772.1 MAG: hypothetical protein BECKH772C_GA0070978_108701 [Candidatus Kentron sp. H]
MRYPHYPNRKTGMDYKALPSSNPSVTKVPIRHTNLVTTSRPLPVKLNHFPTLYEPIGAWKTVYIGFLMSLFVKMIVVSGETMLQPTSTPCDRSHLTSSKKPKTK